MSLENLQGISAGSYGVFAFHTKTNIPVSSVTDNDWVGIVLNTVEATMGSDIFMNTNTGHLTLQPGIYRIGAVSGIAYWNFDAQRPPTHGGFAGYVVLRDATTMEILVAGSIAPTSGLVPSLIDTVVTVTEPTTLFLDHQVGERTEGMYTGFEDTVFARLTCIRLPENVEFAVFAYYPTYNLPLLPGWNRRSYNSVDAISSSLADHVVYGGSKDDDTDAREDSDPSDDYTDYTDSIEATRPFISLSHNQSKVVLQSGVYHIRASSMVMYIPASIGRGGHQDTEDFEDMYCVLREERTQALSRAQSESEEDPIISTGTLADPVGGAPSLLTTIVQVPEGSEKTLYVEHWAGYETKNLYFGLDSTGTHMHVFARLSITRIEDYT